MNETQLGVRLFHEVFGSEYHNTPTIPTPETTRLRIDLIQEEFTELILAMRAGDLAHIAKEIGDLLYVVYGAACAYGIDMEPISREIQRSNMSKVGGTRAENGKWIKPDTYSPANIAPIIALQQQENV